MEFLQNLSYIQIVFIILLFLSALSCISMLLTGNAPDVKKWNESPKETVGWLEFRHRPALYAIIQLLLTIWISWNAVGAYCYGREPGYYFQQEVQVLLSPGKNTTDATSVLLVLLLSLLDGLHRLYITVNINIFSRRQTMSIVEAAITYIVVFVNPFLLIADGPLLIQQEDCLKLSSISLLQVVGIVLAAVSFYILNVANKALAKLRRNRFGHITTTEYKQPKGGLFDLVGCPIYFGDLLGLLGYGLVFKCASSTWWLFFAMSTLHFVVKAGATKQFYLKKFDDYPKDKNMLIPYIY